jgi:hypothetical protein
MKINMTTVEYDQNRRQSASGRVQSRAALQVRLRVGIQFSLIPCHSVNEHTDDLEDWKLRMLFGTRINLMYWHE